MDWSLITFIVIVAFFAYRGYKKGLRKSLSRVLSLLAGYVVAILYTPQVSVILESQYQLQGLTSLISASLLLFISAGVAVSILFWVFGKLLPANENISVISSIGGVSMGLIVGVIIAIAIVWTFSFTRDMRDTEERSTQIQTKKSTIETIASQVVSQAVKSAMSISSSNPEITKLSAALIESPAKITQHAQRLAGSNDLGTLLNEPQNLEVLNRGDVDALQKLPAFQKLVNNPDMLALAESAGMLDKSNDDTHNMEASLARQLSNMWGRTQQVKNDKRVQEILSDPEFQQKIQSGNPIDMLTNVRLLELGDIIFAGNGEPDEDASNNASSIPPDNSSQDIPKKETTIYSWTDKNGRIHYSDSEPEK